MQPHGSKAGDCSTCTLPSVVVPSALALEEFLDGEAKEFVLTSLDVFDKRSDKVTFSLYCLICSASHPIDN